MKILKYLLLFTIVIVFTNCNNKYSKEIAEIDKLITLTEELKVKSDNVDFNKINEQYSKYKKHLDLIKDYVNSDDSVMNKSVLEYALIRRPLKNLVKDEQRFKDELEHTLEQLKTLKADIKSGKLDSIKIVEYMDTEKRATLRFVSDYSIIIDEAIVHSVMFDSLYPQMDAKLKDLIEN